MTGQPLSPFVIKLGRIGDMIMLTAAIQLLHARYRKPCYVVGADAWAPGVYLGLSEVEWCGSLPRKAPILFGLAWPAILRALRDSAPGPIYVFEHHPPQVRRIRRLLRAGGVDPRRCLFIDETPGTELPWIDALLRFARRTPSALDATDYPEPGGCGPWLPRLRVVEAERAARERWLRSRGFHGQPLVLVQPGNHRTMGRRRLRNWRGRDDKVWPVERWAQLLQMLHSRMPEAMLVLRGAKPEMPLLESVAAAAALPCVTCAGTELRPLFALCEMAHSMISVDSGPAHAAAALGLPLLVLYGTQAARVWLPRSSNGSPVVAIGGPPEFERAEQISVAAVYEAWCGLVAASRAGTAQAAAQVEFELPPAPLSNQTTSVTMEPSAFSSSVR
ncbi:MAG TPA: glycosyltransferase family 9 protein [Steroidobacteraceae bacterium]|jgi:heptosyltransferase-2/heptosyltransferase-3|nr:glycosyltransferase family 9 protein [Steroidobacteraceae bacterium]